MKVGILGASGRMGLEVARELLQNDIAEISGAVVEEGNTNIGKDLGELLNIKDIGIKISTDLDELFKKSEAVIDFSIPLSTLKAAEIASKYGKILVSGTTGLSEEDKRKLVEFASNCTMIWSPNMSIGVNLLLKIVEEVSEILHDDYDAEIFEMHHRNKIDAPSGTALALGEAVAKGRGLDFGEVCRRTRDGITGKRSKSEIGFASLRGGSVVGDHSVIFAGDSDVIEITHKASDRSIYAKGAIRAAIWAYNKPNGLYNIRNVLSKEIISNI